MVIPSSGATVTIASDDELEQQLRVIISAAPERFTLGQQLYFLAPQLACVSRLYDGQAAGVLRRFVHSRDLGLPAFAGAYDDLPAWWLDAVTVIQIELAAVARCHCPKCMIGRNG